MGLFAAILDAIFQADDRIAGKRFTQLAAPLSPTETSQIVVTSTNGFGRFLDGEEPSLLLINGELIEAATRTTTVFAGLTRGIDYTHAKEDEILPVGTLVFDASHNTSAKDHLRRGFLVRFARGEDLDVIGDNLGLHRCPGIPDDVWRELIQAMAYLPKQTLDAFRTALMALFGNDTAAFRLTEIPELYPWQVFVEITAATLAEQRRGKWFLSGGEEQLTTGLLTIDTTYPINQVLGVYEATELARRGFRDGMTNYYQSHAGSTVTMNPSPGASGTAMIVDYGAFTGHYLAPDEAEVQDEDFYAYLADPTATAKCVLNQIRAAGVRVNFGKAGF